MAKPTLDELLAELESPEVQVRLEAATRLRDLVPPPVSAIPRLVAHIQDEGGVDEEWTDWDGSVVGGTTHRVADRVVEALVPLGTPAFTAVLTAVEDGAPRWALQRLAALLPMDALVAAGNDMIARAQRFSFDKRAEVPDAAAREPWSLREAADALAWAQDELLRTEDRMTVLGRRLLFSVGQSDRLAAEELGAMIQADTRRAATLLAEALLHVPAPSTVAQSAVAKSLDKLGPVLDAPLASRLVAIASTNAMFHCWPELLPAVASYGEAARSLGPWLLAWVRDEEAPIQIGREHHANVRNGAAIAIGRLGKAARPLHDALAEIYAAGPDARRQLVLSALPDRGVLVAKLGPRWRTLLAGSEREAIESVLDAIHDLGVAAAPLLDAISPFIEGAKGYWRAVLTVGELGEAARPVVRALIRALQNPNLRTWACISLEKFGPDLAGGAVSVLEELAAQDRREGVRNSRAAQALDTLRRR